MSATTEKLFQPDSDGPDAKLEVERAGQYTYLWLRERGPDGWTDRGVVELHPALEPSYSGQCAGDGPVLEWATTRYHASGDRVRVGSRVRLVATDDGLRVVLERDREEVLGVGRREEHGWRAVREWRVSGDGIREREVSGRD